MITMSLIAYSYDFIEHILLNQVISNNMWDKYQLYSNVDAIAAAILSDLGVP